MHGVGVASRLFPTRAWAVGTMSASYGILYVTCRITIAWRRNCCGIIIGSVEMRPRDSVILRRLMFAVNVGGRGIRNQFWEALSFLFLFLSLSLSGDSIATRLLWLHIRSCPLRQNRPYWNALLLQHRVAPCRKQFTFQK